MEVGAVGDAEVAFRIIICRGEEPGVDRTWVFLAHLGIGDLLVERGELNRAFDEFKTAMDIALRERLAQTRNPGNSRWQRNLSVVQGRIGDVLRIAGNLADALTWYQASLAIRERLAQANSGNADRQRDLSGAKEKVGDVLAAQGDLAPALAWYQASLAIRERLAQADPGNADRQRDLSGTQDKVGDVLAAQGNLSAALDRYRASLATRERLAQADGGNARSQRDVLFSIWRLATIETSGVSWSDVWRRMLELKHSGKLLPIDEPFLERAHALAGGD